MDTWIRGDTNRVQVTVTDNGGTTSLVGATIKAALSVTVGGAPVLEATTADFDIADNVATLTLGTADTAALLPGVYWWEAEVTDAAGKRQSAQAQVYITKDTIT